jgi:hypothetical protein
LRSPSTETPAIGATAAPEESAPPILPDSEYIDIKEYRDAAAAGAPVTVVDARTERTLDESDKSPANSVRVHPEQAVAAARALGLPQGNLLAVLCA